VELCVLGTPVRSTFPIAEWAAGANAPRRRQLHQEAPPIRTRYAGMAAGYSDVDRCCRRPRTNAIRENGYPARLLQKRGAHPLSQRLEHWSAEVEAREMMGGSVVVEADSLFVACPRCSAWPMAANVTTPNWAGRREISFSCPCCRHEVTVKAQAAPGATHAKPEATVDR
jgi:hypothetical protein